MAAREKEMEDGDIAEVITRMTRDFARRRERREEAYKYERREFDLWVSSVKAPRSAMEAFRCREVGKLHIKSLQYDKYITKIKRILIVFYT